MSRVYGLEEVVLLRLHKHRSSNRLNPHNSNGVLHRNRRKIRKTHMDLQKTQNSSSLRKVDKTETS